MRLLVVLLLTLSVLPATPATLQIPISVRLDRIDVDYDGFYLDGDLGSSSAGSVVGTVYFNNWGPLRVVEGRVAFEFDLSALPVAPSSITSATLNLRASGGGSPYTTVGLYGYSGNGTIDESDLHSTNLLQIVATEGSAFAAFTGSFDVTAFVQAQTGFAGFGLRSLNPNLSDDYSVSYYLDTTGPINLRYPLLVVEYTEPVPEPGSAAFVVAGLVLCFGYHKRRAC